MTDLAVTAAPLPGGIPLAATMAGIIVACLMLLAWALATSRRRP